MIYFLLFFLSVCLTFLVRYFAIKKSIIDIPNDRSSHIVPTPRGGGLAIVISLYVGIGYLYLNNLIETRLLLALLSALPIVIVGLVDDIIMLSSKVRFIIQFLASSVAIFCLGGVSSIDFILFELSGWWLNIIALLSIIWMTNLYNFLDGIDGYAASQAVIVGLGVFFLLNNVFGLIIVVSTLGFLCFNWPKASIFMGDVGSTTLGFIFAILCFYDTSNGNIFIWLILLSLFWFDATTTLIRRYRNNENITQAHRKHAYQRLTQAGWSHKKVTFMLIGFGSFFLLLLFFIPSNYYLYLFLIILVILYNILKFVDTKKEFI